MPAVTLFTQPSYSLGSSNNDSIFVVSGSAGVTGSVFDFKYIADVYVSGSFLTRLIDFTDPNYGYGVFNLKKIVNNLTSFDFLGDVTAEGTGSFHIASNSSTNIILKLGKEFSTIGNFTQSLNEISSSNFTYLNSSIPFVQQGAINWNQYQLTPGQSGSFLTTNTNVKTFNSLRQWLYFYNVSGSVKHLKVSTFDNQGNPLSTYSASNPYSGSSGVQIASVGIPQLSNFVNFTNVSSYTVNLYQDSGSLSQLVNYSVLQDCGRYAGGAYKAYWLNTFGGFDSWLFNKKNETTTTKTQSTYQKLIGKVKADGSYPINTYSRSVIPFYTELQDSIVLNTDFLLDVDVTFLKGLFSSPVVYLEDPTGILFSATIDTSSYVLNKRLNNKIFSLSLTFLPSNKDLRQLL